MKHDVVLPIKSLISKWTKYMSYGSKVKRDYCKEGTTQQFSLSSPLSHFHLDIWRNFKILLRAEYIVWKLNI